MSNRTTEVKSFNETFSGWDTETRGGGVAGFEGYSYAEAATVATNVRENMRETRGIIEIKVNIVPMGNGKFKVVNTSTYNPNP